MTSLCRLAILSLLMLAYWFAWYAFFRDTETFNHLQAETLPNVPPDILQALIQTTGELVASGIAGDAMQVGEHPTRVANHAWGVFPGFCTD